ncbi:MAG: hypothetical protein JJ863_34180 [Deltaproteobacteria bacterium]|nr:hypothetical protein [Deltaproteobacteria bacterium]
MRWVILFSGLLIACGDDDGSADGPGSDMAVADSGSGESDAGGGDDGGPAEDGGSLDDGGPEGDMGPVCSEMNPSGFCSERGVSCECCPAGGPRSNCLCTSTCMTDDDCTNAERPRCNRDMMNPGATGICTPTEFACAWGAICASPDTPIATPDGDRAIGTLVPGDLVFSIEDGAVVAVPIARVAQTEVDEHVVVRIRLDGGDELFLSPGHPLADGGSVGELEPGDLLGELEVLETELVEYEHPSTHDILPASETGAYFAGGALMGSSLFE